MVDFTTLGELLIDFTPSGERDGRNLFMQNPGGAVANVAAAISGFGLTASYLGMVGNDQFGKFLENVLTEKGVNTSGLIKSEEYNTTLAFVHLFENGDRDFSFYRNPGADIMYSPENLDENAVKNTKIFHFGSLSLTNEPSRSATYKALEIAKREGVTVSYDPNLRAPLWENEKQALKYILSGMQYSDILKISDNEIKFLYGDITYEKAALKLIDEGIKLVFITLGSDGAIYANSSGIGKAEGIKAKAIDATGAGDCFTAGVLYKYLTCGKELDDLNEKDIAGFAEFANAAASICVERMGGIPAMPSVLETEQRLGL